MRSTVIVGVNGVREKQGKGQTLLFGLLAFFVFS
jgi:hypothetical protein